MEQGSTVHAVYAESLVFESNFGSTERLTTNSSDEAAKRAEFDPAGGAAALTSENARTSGTRKWAISDQVWPGF